MFLTLCHGARWQYMSCIQRYSMDAKTPCVNARQPALASSPFFIVSLRSKRFRRVFCPFEAFFDFWRRKNWGERNTDGRSGEGEGRRENLSSLPLPLLVLFCARPNFEAKNASNLRKPRGNLRKRLLRRLLYCVLTVIFHIIKLEMH